MSQRRRTFTPGPAYRLFLSKLYEARIARGHSLEELSEIIGFTTQQIASFESGAHPLTFTDVPNWLLALDVPFVSFAHELDDLLDSTLTTDEGITFPIDTNEANAHDKFARAEPLPHQIPTIQVIFFAPGQTPEVRRIENTLESKQALVQGLITTFETGVEGTIGIANDEALLEDMLFNRQVSTTGGHLFGPFLVAGDAPGGFRSGDVELTRKQSAKERARLPNGVAPFMYPEPNARRPRRYLSAPGSDFRRTPDTVTPTNSRKRFRESDLKLLSWLLRLLISANALVKCKDFCVQK